MIQTKAPGKLIIAGEWAVLKPGNLAIVAAVNKYVHVTIEDRDIPTEQTTIDVVLPDLQINTTINIEDKQLIVKEDKQEIIFDKIKFILACLKIVNQIKPIKKSFKIVTDSSDTIANSNNQQLKIGFGSSAAVTVATIKALLKFLKIESKLPYEEFLFKLATIAHFEAQGKLGSGFDIAAATYGQTICYSRYDSEHLQNQLRQKSLIDVIRSDWRHLQITKAGLPDNYSFLIGFTGKPASTTDLLKKMQIAEINLSEEINQIYDKINQNTLQLIDQIKAGNNFYSEINYNQKLLEELDQLTNVGIVTPKLKALSENAMELNLAAKLSGAGGGDCGIGFYQTDQEKEQLQNAWWKSGIEVINANIL